MIKHCAVLEKHQEWKNREGERDTAAATGRVIPEVCHGSELELE